MFAKVGIWTSCDNFRIQITCSMYVVGLGNCLNKIKQVFLFSLLDVIHTNGPGEGQPQWPEMLKSCYKMSLELMISKGLRTIVRRTLYYTHYITYPFHIIIAL